MVLALVEEELLLSDELWELLALLALVLESFLVELLEDPGPEVLRVSA